MSQQDLDLGMLDKMINYCLHKNKSKLDDELISKIHNQVYVQYNTLNIAVGRQRCGKTHTIIKEIIKISAVSKRTHLLIYINKNGRSVGYVFGFFSESLTASQKNSKHYI